ncbi:MAG: class I tRNA ligase family protein, partial [Gammaproteobacteria bacterium]
KGNVLDPIDLIDGIDLESLVAKRTSGLMNPKDAPKIERQTRKEFPEGIPSFGTDSLRFTFAALAATGRDIKFDMGRIEGYRNFCNKLWNAARYVLMNTEEHDCGADVGAQSSGQPGHPQELVPTEEIELSVADRWIISRLQQTITKVTEAIEGYRFDHAAQAIYEFTWNEYCDWYLELSKPVLVSENSSEQQRRGTRRTLVRVLETLLRLTHPIMPFITEEIWQRVAPLAGVEGDEAEGEITIMHQPYPVADPAMIDTQAISEMEWVMQFILGIRRIKGEMNIAPGKQIPVLLGNASKTDIEYFANNRHYLDFLARTESVEILAAGDDGPESATALVGEMKLLIPLSGLIDKDAELERLNKEMSRLQQDLERCENKLANPGFVDKAPEAVIQKERDKMQEAKSALRQLEEQANRIGAL